MTEHPPPGPRFGPIRVIVNASAGSKGGLPTNTTSTVDVEAVLHHVGIEAEIVESATESDARRLAAEAVRKRYAAVVAVGGDERLA